MQLTLCNQQSPLCIDSREYTIQGSKPSPFKHPVPANRFVLISLILLSSVKTLALMVSWRKHGTQTRRLARGTCTDVHGDCQHVVTPESSRYLADILVYKPAPRPTLFRLVNDLEIKEQRKIICIVFVNRCICT